jgi:hypothetical protein
MVYLCFVHRFVLSFIASVSKSSGTDGVARGGWLGGCETGIKTYHSCESAEARRLRSTCIVCMCTTLTVGFKRKMLMMMSRCNKVEIATAAVVKRVP